MNFFKKISEFFKSYKNKILKKYSDNLLRICFKEFCWFQFRRLGLTDMEGKR